ncbi:MAG TPA: transglycosylase domain-containing protein [Jatrophihabitantaceae bacterium]|nr:transglycosylase domain-containing protein [Jatrophihabitantaceae bacterium]
MSERLQRGGPKRVKPESDMPFNERMKHLPTWWKKRHAAKKRRLAAMTRKRRIWRRVGVVATTLLSLIALMLVSTVVLFYTLTNVPRPETLALPQVAKILYANGTTLSTIGDQNRTIIRLDQVPQQVRWEVLAAEDRGFYSEPGVSIKGTLRAVASDLTGGDTQGGSGITQQYVKNAYLNDSRTLSRKLKELMIAVKLARQYSKDQILEFYLNRVYFGRGAYGIEAAAQTYFGVDISKVTVAQGAVLAALLRAPSYYDPAVNPAAARSRWQYVLDGMVATKHLTQQQEAAVVYPTALKPRASTLGATGWAALIQYQVLAELEAHGISRDDVINKGMTIRTTIDPSAQNAAVSAIQQTFSNLTKQQRNMKNALVAVNPATGAVLAYYGGPNGKDYAGVVDNNDYAGIGARPAGSSFKPYTLATALTETLRKTAGVPHYTIDSYVDGSQCVHITGVKICNDPSDAPYSSSSIQVKRAMYYSLNTTFDQMAEAVGPDQVAKIAHAAGVSKTIGGKPTLMNSDGSTSFGIGIGDYAVHPIDQAVGFATFANNGVANAAFFVQKVTASDGSIVYEHKAQPVQAVDPKVANDVTLTLEPIAANGDTPMNNGRVAAAKTGTEGISTKSNANSDAWLVGYTPQVSAAVWVGSGDSVHPIVNSGGGPEYGRDLPGKTWTLFMNAYLANKPNLPMATKQMITGGESTAPKPTKSPTPTPSKTTAVPTFTPSTGFSSSSVAPTTTAPTSTPSPTCTPALGKPCPPGGSPSGGP